jgi:preprotein translocase SecE subunit
MTVVSQVSVKRRGQGSTSAGGFVEDTRQELKKVDWPSREAVIKATSLILVIMVFSVVFIAGVDVLLARLFMVLKQVG